MEKLQRRIGEVEKALKTLKEISQEPYSVVVRDAAIQRFEYTFEAFWEFLRDYLREIEGIRCNSPKSCFREALSAGLLSDEQTMTCIEMTDDRNLTAHTYIEGVAEQMYKKSKGYYKLMNTLSSRVRKSLESNETS